MFDLAGGSTHRRGWKSLIQAAGDWTDYFVSCSISIYNLREIQYSFFFFQAEDGIRDYKVTGVQTCALPISEDDPAEGPTRSSKTFHQRVGPSAGSSSAWPAWTITPAAPISAAASTVCAKVLRDRESGG